MFSLGNFMIVVVIFFYERRSQEILRSYPYFQNALLIFMIFMNEYDSRNGRHVEEGAR